MPKIQVRQRFDVDAHTAFDVISDHAGYDSLPGVRRAWLRRTGDRHRDGVNAERVLELGFARVVERITEYQPGQALGYRIIESPLPIEHFGARITFAPVRDRAVTDVTWTSELAGTTPVVGAAGGYAIAQQLRFAFSMALRIWAYRLR